MCGEREEASNQARRLSGIRCPLELEIGARDLPSPSGACVEAFDVECLPVLEHEAGGASDTSGEDAERLALAVAAREPLEMGLAADGPLSSQPADVKRGSRYRAGQSAAEGGGAKRWPERDRELLFLPREKQEGPGPPPPTAQLDLFLRGL